MKNNKLKITSEISDLLCKSGMTRKETLNTLSMILGSIIAAMVNAAGKSEQDRFMSAQIIIMDFVKELMLCLKITLFADEEMKKQNPFYIPDDEVIKKTI